MSAARTGMGTITGRSISRPSPISPGCLLQGRPISTLCTTTPGTVPSGSPTNEAEGHYNSLQFDLHGKVRRDLQLQFGYTYAKAMDATTSTGSGGDLNNATNPYVGWQYDSGPSIYDRRNVAFVNFVYDIPFLRTSGNRLMKTE